MPNSDIALDPAAVTEDSGGIPRRRLALLAILLITTSVYIRTAFFEFTYDDLAQIVYNERIQSWSYAIGHFTTHVWAQTGGTPLYYRPLFMLWLMSNYSLFGLNPIFWHLSVLALHLLCCVLLFSLLRRLAVDARVATVSTLLFALHPTHVESVAWISGATDPLMGVLFLASLLCYWKHYSWKERETNAWLFGSWGLAFLAVLAKESALILPGVIFAYEWILNGRELPLRKRAWSAVVRAEPFAIVVMAFLLMRAAALHSVTPPRSSQPLLAIVLGWPEVILFYLGHLLIPFRLTVFYNLIAVHQPGWRNFGIPLIITVACLIAAYYAIRKKPLSAFLVAWGILSLIPVVNVTLWDNVENVHDRYLYMPSMAFCALAVVAVLDLNTNVFIRRASVTLLAALTLLYAFLTVYEARYWKNDFVLAQRGLTLSPGHHIATQLFGHANMRRGNFAEAIPYFEQALQMKPDNVESLWALGLCYTQIELLPQAERYALRAQANHQAEPRMHLLLGRIRIKQRRLDEAETELRRAVQLQSPHPVPPLYHYYLANVLYAKGNLNGALAEYRMELLNDPGRDPSLPESQMRIDEIQIRLSNPPVR